MNKGIIGKKIGMTQIFDEIGNVIPVTVIQAGPCVVAQKKTAETDGYDAIQLGFVDAKEKHLTKAEKGHFEKAGVSYQSFFNRSDARSGSTLGVAALTRLGMAGADVGLAQLAMHSACECFALSDYAELVSGLTAFYSSDFIAESDGFTIR